MKQDISLEKSKNPVTEKLRETLERLELKVFRTLLRVLVAIILQPWTTVATPIHLDPRRAMQKWLKNVILYELIEEDHLLI